MALSNCQARQYSDQMQCGRCGLAWDVNDPDPPGCMTRSRRKAIDKPESPRAKEQAPLDVGAEHLERMRDGLRYED